ncbi:MAG: hypothetical protein A2915_02435 [Candidatus Yanofskybacteria bacterium RIFCSPLOWO2_01_FULL_41_34]|nr:MAG: hypothetical protein A2915_02435 [Candidatus Yanofskybacteria bacterium RIFCSPLOWO2_01_FULL_41_34]
MENFKFAVISIIVLAGIGLLGYWAFITLEPGEISVYRQKQEELEARNRELEKELAELKSELGTVAAEKEKLVEATAETEEEAETLAPATYKNQALINELEKLVSASVFMKAGSQGTRVGTVQTFLNLYNKTSKPVDNDYGPGMKTDVLNFQKAQGLTADGEAGPATFKKMIEWLKKQG